MNKRKRILRAHSMSQIAWCTCVVLVIFCAGASENLLAAPAMLTQQPQRLSTSGAQSTDDGIEILPDRVLQHIVRGDQLAGLRRYDEAVAEYQAAIQEAGRPVVTAYLNMGTAFFNKQDYPHAVEAFRQALALKPNSWQGHYNLGEALYAAEDFAGAEREYRRVLELPSRGLATRTRHFLGLALYKQGRLDEAIVEYRAAIEQAAGKYAEAHYNLGIALLERDQPQAAEPEFRLAVEQEKTAWPEAEYNLAKALERQKRFREAADQYEVYLKLAPNAADAKRMREYIDYLRRKK